METTLTYTDVTIASTDFKGNPQSYKGKEAQGTGLGYYVTYPDEEKRPYHYHIVHLESGRTLAPYIILWDEQTVRMAIEEIVEEKLANWTLPVEELYASIPDKKEMAELLKDLTERYQRRDNASHFHDFAFSFTLTGEIVIHSTGEKEAAEIAKQVLEELKEDDDEVKYLTIDNVSLG